MARLLTIGALARATGIRVKTIRHYSDTGVLPPADRTDSRYRLYRDADRARLEVIRLLRSLDFDLPTISALLGRRRTVRQSVRAHLGAVDAKLRALRRTRAVLARAEASPTDDGALATLERLHAVAVLDAAERSAVLRQTMERHLEGVPADATWQSRLWDVAFKDLPDDLSDAQWSALVELIDLVQDDDFGRRLADQGRSYWAKVRGRDPRASLGLARLVQVAARAADRQDPPGSARSRRLTRRFVTLSARAAGRRPTRAFERWMLAQAAKHDPRSERFWWLVATIRGWSTEPRPEVRAYRWLFAALAADEESGDRDDGRGRSRGRGR
jgi:DNA-binding transcriptional MerR regulator